MIRYWFKTFLVQTKPEILIYIWQSKADVFPPISITQFVFVWNHKYKQQALPGGCVVAQLITFFKLSLSPDQLGEKWHWEQHWVWRDGLRGVYKYLRCASTGLPSAETWLGACAKHCLALAPLYCCRLQARTRADWRHISGYFTAVISCRNWNGCISNTCIRRHMSVVRNMEKCVCINNSNCLKCC